MNATYQAQSNSLFLATHLIRKCADGDFINCDVLIYFEVAYGPYGREANFCHAAFDGGAPDDAPGDISDKETNILRQWFHVNQDKCADLVCADPAMDYGCWRYHQLECV